MYVRLISWDCFTYSGNWNGLFVNLLVEISQVRKYLKFLIMSTSPRHVRDLSRPASRWHALDLVLVSLLLNFQEQFLVFTLLTLNKEILPGQDLKKFSVIAHFTLYRAWFNRFSTNFPLTDKPGSWFLRAKCWKKTCGRVTY